MAACASEEARQAAAQRAAEQRAEQQAIEARTRARMNDLRPGMSCTEVEHTLNIVIPIPCKNLAIADNTSIQMGSVTLVFYKGALTAWK
jgi:hypothetical protein